MAKCRILAAALLVIVCTFPLSTHAKGTQAKVTCKGNSMIVIVPLDEKRERAYLDQLKGYEACAPSIEEGAAVFRLDLEDVHQCGVTRVTYQPTGKRIFYHKVAVESDSYVEMLTVRCSLGPDLNHQLTKREVDLPAGFQEPENLEITTSLTERAPEPQLGVAVSQDGKEVSGEISVRPGTPLAMKVFLDKGSAPVYGLMVSHLQVSDTATQQETIVFNGCSVDPYLFDNFVTTNGDSLEAKFRAFKFPDTTYVQFRGTVQVCLDKCQGAPCSNGATGYGRRRRAINSGSENNKLYEISLTTFIKVEDDNNEADDVSKLLRNLKIANQMLDDSTHLHLGSENNSGEVQAATVREKPQSVGPSFTVHEAPAASKATFLNSVSVTLLVVLCAMFYALRWRS